MQRYLSATAISDAPCAVVSETIFRRGKQVPNCTQAIECDVSDYNPGPRDLEAFEEFPVGAMHRRLPVRTGIGQQTPWRRHMRAFGLRQRRGESPAVQKLGVGRTGQGEQDGSKGRYGEFPGRGTWQ